MVIQEILISIVGGVFVVGITYRHYRGKDEAREWYGESIQLVTKVVNHAEQELGHGDESNFTELATDLKPLAPEIRAHAEDDRGKVCDKYISFMNNLYRFIYTFETRIQLFEEGDMVEFLNDIINDKKESLNESVLESSLEEVFPDELVQVFDIEQIQDDLEGVDLEKGPELAELILADFDETPADSWNQLPIRDAIEFPYEDYAVFDEFTDLLEPSLEGLLNQYVEAALITYPEKMKEGMKQEQQGL